MRIAIIGAGRLACALAPTLAHAGHRIVAVSSRRPAAARSLAARLPGARAMPHPEEAAALADLVLLAVPDSAIAAVARKLAAANLEWSARVVLHHAGALGADVLRPLARAGAAVGVLHPLQCLGDPRLAGELLPSSRARVAGDPRALRAAKRVMRDLGMKAVDIPDTAAARRAYHAAAALVSNDLVALFDIALEQLRRAGLDERDARRALVPLARGTLRHIESGGLDAALTGPAARGDAATVAAHLRSLGGGDGGAAGVHRRLSGRLATRAGGAAAARRLAAALARRAARGYSSKS